MKPRVLVAGVLLVASIGVLGWFSMPAGHSEAPVTWPDPVKDAEARSLLERECRAARREDKPLLVEFSAPWCEHCRAVKQAMQAPELSRLSSSVRTLVLNIGDDAELNDVRRELGALAIPAWVAVRPTDCEARPSHWKKVASTYPRGEERGLREFLEPLGEL